MKNKFFSHIIPGIVISHTINFTINLITSLIANDGHFNFLVPGFVERVGNEITAVVINAVLLTVFGAIYGYAGTIFEREDWSLMRQTVTHFLALIVTFILIGYYLMWLPQDFGTLLSALILFIIIYALIFFFIYRSVKKQITDANKKLAK